MIKTANGKRFSSVRVFNTRGQLLNELLVNQSGFMNWDGKDKSGKALASGVYLISAKVDGNIITRKILIRR
jgi:hypothetical protein